MSAVILHLRSCLLALCILTLSSPTWADMSIYNGDTPQHENSNSAINGPAPAESPDNKKPDDHMNHDFDPNRREQFRDPNPYVAPIAIAPFPPNCGPTTVIVCKTPVPVPYTGTIGSTYTLAMPYPYVNRTFPVQCVDFDGAISFQVLNPGNISCADPICTDSTLNICGTPVPVTGGTYLDDRVEVPLPASIVGAVGASSQTVTAACVETGTGIPTYQLENASQISCNTFPCTASTVRLCGTSIPIAGGARNGEVVHMTMPAPFAPDPFDVTCLGTLGEQPAYQLYSSAAVTCTMATPAPAQ